MNSKQGTKSVMYVLDQITAVHELIILSQANLSGFNFWERFTFPLSQ